MSVPFERLFGSKGAGICLVDVVVANPEGSGDSGLAAIDGLKLDVGIAELQRHVRQNSTISHKRLTLRLRS